MFSRVAVSGGTSRPVAHDGRVKIVDYPPVVSFDTACELARELDSVDIVVLVGTATWMADCRSTVKVFEDRAAARNRAGYYQMLVKVVGKYDFEDPEIDELVADSAVRRICGLKLVAGMGVGATPSVEPTAVHSLAQSAPATQSAPTDWAVREYVKAARFRGELTTHEREILALATADDTIAMGRMCSVLRYISDNGIDNIPHICELLRQCGGDPAVYMQKIADQLRGRSVGTQYVYLRKYGEMLGMGRLDYMSYLGDSHLKCPVYAAQNNRTMLAKYLYVDDAFESLPLSLEMQLPWTRMSYIWRTSYTDVCSTAGAADVQDIIREIGDGSLREYFQMGFFSYEELLADIVAGNYKKIKTRVIGAGVNWNNFRRRLSADYFVHGRRGTVHALVCECASG